MLNTNLSILPSHPIQSNPIQSNPIPHSLVDFGSASFLADTKSDYFTANAGTLAFQAPEILNHTPYRCEVDLWSLGVTLYYLLFKRYPFFGYQSLDLYQDIIQRGLVLRNQDYNAVSKNAIDLVKRLLVSE